MEKRKIVSIILGLIIILMSILMPFYLKRICYEFSIHQEEWSLGVWNAVQIHATICGFIISILTIVLVLLNVLKNKRN